MADFRSQFRLPPDLAEKLKQSAQANHRSLNAELVSRLERSYSESEQLDRIEAAVNTILTK